MRTPFAYPVIFACRSLGPILIRRTVLSLGAYGMRTSLTRLAVVRSAT
jgi:hypothetical protein